MDGGKSPAYACCFCGLGIEYSAVDPVALSIWWREDSPQDLHAHLLCLQLALHPNVPLLSGAEFDSFDAEDAEDAGS